MKSITMTEWRNEPGERITDIRRDGASFLITKGGKPVARLLPVKDIAVSVATERSTVKFR